MATERTLQNQIRWDRKAGALRLQARHYALVEAAGLKPGMRVLDLGSGRGETAVLAALAGARVQATDVGPALVDVARRNASEAGVEIATSVADIRDLSGLSTGYDVVFGCAVLHHLDEADVRRAVGEAVRVLAPGGRALFFEPVENVDWFDFIKHCFPGPKQRPSILKRRAWREWMKARDDRWMSDAELLSASPRARIVGRCGLLGRLQRTPLIERIDTWLLSWKPLHRFAQAVIVEYSP